VDDPTAARTLDELRAAVAAGARPKFLFFWSERPGQGGDPGKGCLSQWWPAPFELDGERYPTAEHWMMAEKARLFGDREALAEVLTVEHPGAAKAVGRRVLGFDEGAWARARVGIVRRGSLAKFSQHPELRAYLIGTGARVLVEASPRDPVWGIGLAEGDPAARDVGRWRGANLLGFALMAVRARLVGPQG
jgi:ribA/ribD-fused uncharacterized protein